MGCCAELEVKIELLREFLESCADLLALASIEVEIVTLGVELAEFEVINNECQREKYAAYLEGHPVGIQVPPRERQVLAGLVRVLVKVNAYSMIP